MRGMRLDEMQRARRSANLVLPPSACTRKLKKKSREVLEELSPLRVCVCASVCACQCLCAPQLGVQKVVNQHTSHTIFQTFPYFFFYFFFYILLTEFPSFFVSIFCHGWFY